MSRAAHLLTRLLEVLARRSCSLLRMADYVSSKIGIPEAHRQPNTLLISKALNERDDRRPGVHGDRLNQGLPQCIDR
jgi:hypothetical protein